MLYRIKDKQIIFQLKSKQETRCLIKVLIDRHSEIHNQLKQLEIKENIHSLLQEDKRKRFEKFTDELIENLCCDL